MKKAVLLLVLLFLVTSCATYVPTGILFTEGKMGMQEDGTKGTKTGKACMNSYLALIAIGDASIDAAKKNGGINKVEKIDYEVRNILGLYGEYCLVVQGK